MIVYFFFSSLDDFFFIFFCIALTRNVSTTLNKNGKSSYTCLVPYYKGNVFGFSSLSIMLAVGLSYMVFIVLSYIPSIPNLVSVFIINVCWIFTNAFFASIDMIIWLSFCLCCVPHLLIVKLY